MNETPGVKVGRINVIAFIAILAVGIFLRLPPALFTSGEALHALDKLHPRPGFNQLGYDEVLYASYVSDLAKFGITAYPAFAEHYVALQSKTPGAILPPTRFVYIFCGYLWHEVTGAEELRALKNVSSFFSILMLLLAVIASWRLGGRHLGLCVAALMAFAPTQIHMSQHALIDGVFTFWATLSLWLLWENLQHPNDWRWLLGLATALAVLVLTKENAMFAYFGLVAIIAANPWLRFGRVTRFLLATMLLGPLCGVAILVNLCGSLETAIQVYQLLVSKAAVLPYAIKTGDGPWYRYLVDLMLVSPLVLLCAIGAAFTLKTADRAAIFLLVFIAASFALMCNVRYGMNLRYANMWDLPLRFLAADYLVSLTGRFRRSNLWLGSAIALLCAIDFRQYQLLFVKFGLYELVPEGLLHALHILK